MTATAAPEFKPDRSESEELHPVDRKREDPYFDATQGRQIGSSPADDATRAG